MHFEAVRYFRDSKVTFGGYFRTNFIYIFTRGRNSHFAFYRKYYYSIYFISYAIFFSSVFHLYLFLFIKRNFIFSISIYYSLLPLSFQLLKLVFLLSFRRFISYNFVFLLFLLFSFYPHYLHYLFQLIGIIFFFLSHFYFVANLFLFFFEILFLLRYYR